MIFNLFKSKPTLKELIPKGFIDIHSHILPGIDDGAKDIEESLELISEMKKLGFSKIIGTPHIYKGLYENDKASISKSFKTLIKKSENYIDISYAAEYMLDSSIIEIAKNKSLLTLKDNYVLVEISMISEINNLKEIIFEIQTNGYIPVIAHPERYLYYSRNFNKIENFKRLGCKLQLNLLALTGFYGVEVLNFSEKILSCGLYNFCGSDVHKMRHLKQFEKKIKLNRNCLKIIEECLNKNGIFK